MSKIITTNDFQFKHEHRPENHPPFDFSKMITTGNVEEVRKKNEVAADVSNASPAAEAKKKAGRPKKD